MLIHQLHTAKQEELFFFVLFCLKYVLIVFKSIYKSSVNNINYIFPIPTVLEAEGLCLRLL